MAAGSDREPKGPRIGDSAPDFSLPDAEGGRVGLSDSRGEWLVLYFYPRDSTSGCTKEARDFTELLPAFQREGAGVIGISPDTPSSHRKFVEKNDLKVRLLSDEDHRVMEAYGAWGAKKMYGRVSMGVIRSTFLIDPEGVVVQVWHGVRVRRKTTGGEIRHADDVLEQLIKSKE